MDIQEVYREWRSNPERWWTTTTIAWPLVQIKDVSIVKYQVVCATPDGEQIILLANELKARINRRVRITWEG